MQDFIDFIYSALLDWPLGTLLVGVLVMSTLLVAGLLLAGIYYIVDSVGVRGVWICSCCRKNLYAEHLTSTSARYPYPFVSANYSLGLLTSRTVGSPTL